jgi:hypothetical protein
MGHAPLGRHAAGCKRLGAINTRHHFVNNALGDELAAATRGRAMTKREVNLAEDGWTVTPGEAVRADLV